MFVYVCVVYHLYFDMNNKLDEPSKVNGPDYTHRPRNGIHLKDKAV